MNLMNYFGRNDPVNSIRIKFKKMNLMDYFGRNDPEKLIRINPFRRVVTFDHIGRHFVDAAFRVDG